MSDRFNENNFKQKKFLLPLLCLVSTTCPEVLMTKTFHQKVSIIFSKKILSLTQALNMIFYLLLLLLTIDTGEMHSVVATVLSRSRPVSLVRK